jgi:hypothetical protein
MPLPYQRGRPISCRFIARMTGWMLAVWISAMAGAAWASCGSYVMLGHGSPAVRAAFAGHPFGRVAGWDERSVDLAAGAVLLLYEQRDAQRARQAGYGWIPSPPVTPCEGPACGGRSTIPEPPLPTSSDYSGWDRWLASMKSGLPEDDRRGRFVPLVESRWSWGDWPEISRPPNRLA